MPETYTDADFERLSWHDCSLWGIELRVGDPDVGDWTSDLALSIDFIVEWLCGVDGGTQFRVAPARLVFHGVTDPHIHLDWDSGLQIAIQAIAIDRLERERIQEQRVYLDRPYYRWRLHLHDPPEGEISFGAVGFTQTLLAEPILQPEQYLTPAQRRSTSIG
jgi:hypothetical protein